MVINGIHTSACWVVLSWAADDPALYCLCPSSLLSPETLLMLRAMLLMLRACLGNTSSNLYELFSVSRCGRGASCVRSRPLTTPSLDWRWSGPVALPTTDSNRLAHLIDSYEPSRCLRSTNCHLLAVLSCVKSSFASRAFCVSSPNNLEFSPSAHPLIWQPCHFPIPRKISPFLFCLSRL